MLVKVKSAAFSGLESIGVDVEINVASRGLPVLDIVGLPTKAVEESKERVKTAILNSQFEFPANRITINLAPADIPKEGSFYDLPIAVGILASQLPLKIPPKSLFFGELSLDGSLRHTKGTLLLALFAKENDFERIFVPKNSANEAAIVKGIKVYSIDNLSQIVSFLSGRININPVKYREKEGDNLEEAEFDMAEILGQEKAKRAMEIAAAGFHNLIMVGSPGAGKTMLARALPGILPPLREEESLEVTKIYSAAGHIPPEGSLVRIRPVRSPHHTISQIGLVGGGSRPQPGEISLAHRGVLFLDEFNELPRSVLESLRQPIEDGKLTISRSREQVTYPARFMLVASANPCPCGFLYHPQKTCSCSPRDIQKYKKRISGPILDRIDLQIEVPEVDVRDLSESQKTTLNLESSKTIRERVVKALDIQDVRFKDEAIFTNSEMKNRHIKRCCKLSSESEKILNQAALKFHLSARAYFKVIKIARTIADLANEIDIQPNHIAEALAYRLRQQ